MAYVLILFRGGDVASTQPVHEIDLAHHVAHVPGDLESEETTCYSTSILHRLSANRSIVRTGSCEGLH